VREDNDAAAEAICSAAPSDYVEAKGRLRHKQQEPPMRKALRIYKLGRPVQRRRDTQDDDRDGGREGTAEAALQNGGDHDKHDDECH